MIVHRLFETLSSRFIAKPTNPLKIAASYSEYTPWWYTLQADLLDYMSVRDILAFNLKRLRRKMNLSQEELADAAGIDRTYVSSLERGQYSASIDVIERLSLPLRVEAFELLMPQTEKP